MAREDWQSVMVLKALLAKAEDVAERRKFPNVTQYVADAIRRALDEDKLKLAQDQKTGEEAN